jgi:clan AA aspartic protease (TIGR02281 family)
MSLPFGIDSEALPVDALDAAWPRPLVGRVVPTGAEPEVAETLPPPLAPPESTTGAARDLADEAVVLPYEGTGRSLTVPVSLEADEAEVDVWMLFDTGATLTTLDNATLKRLGLTVPADAPQLTVRTANGERISDVVLVDRLWIGGFAVEGVSISVCDECAGDNAVGLLGLNVSGRFLVTVDQARRELVLQPRDATRDRSVDIAPWLELWAQASRWPDGRVEVEVEVENLSTREVRDVKVDISCVKTWVAELAVVPPEGSASTIVSLPRGTDCETYSVALGGARW